MPDYDGPDISHWNPVADWDAIPDYDLFSAKATEGKSFRSPTFDVNWAAMRDQDFKYRGAYHWVRSDSTMAAQVKNLKRAIDDHGGLRLGEFIQIDWETTPGIKNVSLKQIEDFQHRVEKEWPGRSIMYASDWVPHFIEWRKRNPTYPLWYANYNTGDKRTGGPAENDLYGTDVWQWTSSADVPGFHDDTIDMNDVLDWDAIHSIAGYKVDTKPAPKPKPTPKPTPTPPSKGTKLNWLNDLKFKSGSNVPNTATIFQSILKSLGYSIQVDGFYGPQSEGGCKWFQGTHGLTIDGWVGPKTWNALAADGPKTSGGEKDAG